MKPILLFIACVCAGCQTQRVTDPKTGVIFENQTFAMKQGPKEITIVDGDRSITIKTGEKDQTAVANKLIELGQALK